jgi:phosphorylcholine metabolism protein LicD
MKVLLLFFYLLFNKIVLKPKKMFSHLSFKLRYKPSLFTKVPHFVKLSLFEKIKSNKYGIFIGEKMTEFDKSDLSIKKVDFKGFNLPVPISYHKFIQKYNDELLSNFYKHHNVQFDSKSEKEAIDFLYQIDEVIKKSNSKYWIEGGTLLGAIRDKKLIPWDHDLDMGIINNSDKEIDKLIKNLKDKFYVSIKSFRGENTWKLGKYRVLKIYPKKWFFFKKELCCDLFVYYKGLHNGEEVFKYVVWGKNAFHKKEYFDKIDSIEFYDKKINVPKNPESFLEVKYGKDWQVPKEKWNVALDDGSIVKT